VATLLAGAVVALGGSGVSALEWTLQDRWTRRPAPASPALLVVTRDAAAEARFGRGAWDRAVLARAITALSRAGATAIGVDLAAGTPSAPGRGGAASDALLSQAIGEAGNVVFAVGPGQPPSPLAQHARGVGHTVAVPDADGVVRRVPLLVRVQGEVIPALAVALAAVRPAPSSFTVDARGRALVGYASPAALPGLPFSALWTAIESRRADVLPRVAEGKVVLLLAEPAPAPVRTPVGAMSETLVQAHLLNAALTGAWLRETPLPWALAATLVVSVLVAWLVLRMCWWAAALALVALLVAGAAALPLTAALTGLLLPAVLPLGAVALASSGALGWRQLGAGHRLRRLEAEVAGIREALIRRESAVEALEEDLEAARAAVARSAGAERDSLGAAETLRRQLAEAQAQEQRTRERLEALERELRTADGRGDVLDDAEQERLRRQCAELGLVTRAPAMLALFRDLARAARSTLPILLTGEPGTGKELFARAAHRLSPRAGGPFVAVNMAAIPTELFESELFGHLRGSFTGAGADRKGYFEQADRGTIFLDEVGELRADHQGKLLRVLQEKSFYRVGAARPTAVDVRILAASNRDLERGAGEGWFREDLYFRLKGLVLRLPPLRERREDIAPLAARFLEEAAAEAGRQVSLSEAAVQALEAHDWPGNVRELANCLRRAVALSERPVLAPADLGLEAGAPAKSEAAGDSAVLASLRQHAFDMQATARALGWDRSTVTQRLKGLGFRALVEAGGDRAKAAAALAGDPGLARAVEVKLGEYHEHLLRSVAGFASADEAVAACRRRFKNLPDRHFRSLEILIRNELQRRA
jgi:DNA-binding NtrC family response regulator/CHASE2 domain-containing sensor protein